jgi:YidC/Oxa1 family membrane protein insertase
MMDRRTLWVVVACMLALFGWQWLINKLYPPRPKTAPPFSTNVTTTATNVVEQLKPAPQAEPVTPRAEERVVALSNDSVRVEFTSLGGGIRSVELLKHKANGHGNALLNDHEQPAALGITDLVGAGTNESFAIEQPDAKTLVLRSASQVTKTFSLGNDYLLTGTIQMPAAVAAGRSNLTLAVGTAFPADPKESPAYLNVDWQGGPKFFNRDISRVTSRTKKGQNREEVRAYWVAVKSQYFAMILSTATNSVGVSYAPVEIPAPPAAKPLPPVRGVTAAMEVPLTRTADGSATCAFTFYAGPKDYDRLVALGKNQDEAMDFGSWMDLYSGIFGLVLLRGLIFFHGLIPSYGVAIILVTIALKIIFWPIQAKSIKSMKQMQKFQPQLQKLKDKYKDDPQRLNQETMKLYKEHKINPFSGCLPMLVQLPILIAFYKVLISDIALRGAAFLWIKDLSQADTIFSVAGLAINPLPLVMVGTMIWQQKITPTSGDPQQAKMMMFMPLIMLVFFYKQAAGLTLYWTLQQLLSILQQWWSMRQERKTGGPPAPLATGKTK